MLPVHAPWSKIAEVIDYVRAVRPRRAFPAHDGLLNDVGLQLVDGLLGDRGSGIGAEYRRPAPAESIELIDAARGKRNDTNQRLRARQANPAVASWLATLLG
jgi:hypothetical protein